MYAMATVVDLHAEARSDLSPMIACALPKAPAHARALVVDDDPDVPELVGLALAQFNIATDVAATGADALARLKRERYDLIILDLRMDEIGGFDILQALRRRPHQARTPVLVLTSDDSCDALARSFGYGADDLVTKPFDIRKLGLRASRLLNRRL